MKEIRIYYANKQMLINPDPVTIELGESVTWIFEAQPIIVTQSLGTMLNQYAVLSLQIQIYFGYELPFDRRIYEVVSQTRSESGIHAVKIKTGPSTKKGDFKYGVKLNDISKNNQIDDVDPRIIVI